MIPDDSRPPGLPDAVLTASENPFALAPLGREATADLPGVLVVATAGTTRGGVDRRLEEEFDIVLTSTLDEARELLRGRRFGLALLDLRETGRTPLELARGLRELDPEMSVIALGAGRDVRVLGDNCLQVPFDSPDIITLAHHEMEMAMRRRGRTAVIRELEGAMAMMREELEAKDSLADYGEASASMVHDLKNALFSTMGYTARLIQETSQLKNAVGDEAAQPIDRIARKLEQTSNYILHLAHTCRYNDAARPVRERLDLRAEIEHVHAVLFFQSPKLRVTVAAGEADDFFVSGDRYELHRVFQNLFKNAFEAGAHAVVATLGRRAGRVVAELADDGPGFPEDEAKVALTKPLKSSKRGGQGLGLRICRQIVERYGGAIVLRSEPGRGAVFTISLPAR
jgi:signal transduction histidine kinase